MRISENKTKITPHASAPTLPIREWAADHSRLRNDSLGWGGLTGRLGADFLLAGFLVFLEDTRLRPLCLRRVGVLVPTLC